MFELGHEVKLIAPQYVRPFVKRQKNDAADAEAIVIAAQRPEMRFVAPKTEDQQARAALFRSRERLVRQRTELINALRGVLYEHGHGFPTGTRNLGRIQAMLDDPENGLHPVVLDECRDLLEQIAEKAMRVEARTKKASALSAQAATTRRLQTIPSVGPLTPRGRPGIRQGSWLARMLERKPKMLVAIALANKMARRIRALLTKQEDYQDPAPMAAA